jgi:Glycosyl hydrolases family 39
MSSGFVRLLALPLFVFALTARPVSAQVSVDYGSRSSSSAKPIPPGIISAQLGFLQSSVGLTLLNRAGFRQMRLDAQLSNVFRNNSTPDWTVIDPVLQSLQQQGFQALIVMDYTPGWLQQTPNPCPAGTSSYHSPPTDVNRWGGLAAQVVTHMNTAFPNLVTDYEIWNEPDIPNGLCAPDDTTRLNDYLAMYAAAATQMRQAANSKPIRIGGPVVVNNPGLWIPALLSNSSTSGLVDFVSYHKYLGFTNLINAGMTWDGANGTPSLSSLIHNFGDSYGQIAGFVRHGSQPNPSSTPIYLTEYNDDAAFSPDCCRNDPTFSPLFNVMTVASLMNSIYSGAQGVPSRLHYFSASTPPPGFFCLVGVLDPNLDCSSSGPLQPYPQYYAYQLLAGSNFLNMAAGGNMAVSLSLPSNLQGFAFYTAAGDALVLVNPSSTDATGVGLTLQNPGSVSSNGVLYLLNGSGNEPMTSSTLPLTRSGNTLSGSVNVPMLSVVALLLSSGTNGVAVSISPTSATLKTGGTQQFTGSASGNNPAVTWSVDGIAGGNSGVGTISTAGLYTAPATPGTHTVFATSVADPTQKASAIVTVQSAIIVSIAPATATLAPGQQQPFTATVSNAANTQVAWSVDDIPNGNPAVGTISSAGVYTAPATAGQHVITASSAQDATASASAQVTVVVAADFTVSPQNSTTETVVAGQSATFLVSAASVSGFSGNIQFSCSGAPPQGTCNPSPAATTLPNGGTITISYIVNTTARTASASLAGSRGAEWMGALAFLSLLLSAGFRRRLRAWWIAGFLAVLLLVSCGGGGGGGGTPPPGGSGTPAGTYNLTLTATSGSVTHNTSAKLVVQ